MCFIGPSPFKPYLFQLLLPCLFVISTEFFLFQTAREFKRFEGMVLLYGTLYMTL